MVSLSRAIFRILSKHSFTVQCSRKLTYSTVIIVPALSLGYFRISFICALVSVSDCFMIRFTTLAGISSIMSTVSSRNISSNTAFNSASEKTVNSNCCLSDSISTNVSAAFSLESNRKTGGISFSGSSSNNMAQSCGIMSFIKPFISLKFFSSSNCFTFSMVSVNST